MDTTKHYQPTQEDLNEMNVHFMLSDLLGDLKPALKRYLKENKDVRAAFHEVVMGF